MEALKFKAFDYADQLTNWVNRKNITIVSITCYSPMHASPKHFLYYKENK